MNTKIVRVDPAYPQESLLREAAQALRNGALVVVPTDTVYGIAADINNKESIRKLYEIKGRPESKPFALLIRGIEQMEELIKDVPMAAYKLADKFWPGPLTMVLRADAKNAIGLRLPDNKIVLKLLELSGVNAACPSANLSGKPAPVSFQEAIKDLEGQVDLAIDAGETKIKTESTVVDLTGGQARILREGALKAGDIEPVLAQKTVLFICTGNSCRSVMAQGYLKKKLKEKGRTDVEVLSAGILGMNNMGATSQTREVLRREGINVDDHASTRVTARMVKRSDIILVMEKMHEERILELVPQARARVFLLKEFARIEDDGSTSIEDPIGNSPEFYERTFYTIKQAVDRVAEII
ncbi:MAG: L-threonylcarbamoyladenylate synthase [Candidatus Omnitrophica bacterium]|nr:L-threonylcarbamoyladenylate synthase [Candidatus Omnitrophota bacterium]